MFVDKSTRSVCLITSFKYVDTTYTVDSSCTMLFTLSWAVLGFPWLSGKLVCGGEYALTVLGTSLVCDTKHLGNSITAVVNVGNISVISLKKILL